MGSSKPSQTIYIVILCLNLLPQGAGSNFYAPSLLRLAQQKRKLTKAEAGRGCETELRLQMPASLRMS